MKRILLLFILGSGLALSAPAADSRGNRHGQQTCVVTVMTKKSGTVKMEISARNASQAGDLAQKQYPGAKIGAALPEK